MAKGENGSNVPQKVGSEITSSNAQNDKRCMRQDDSQGQDPNKILLGPTQNTGADSLGATSCAPSQMPRAPGPGGYKVTGIGGGAWGGTHSATSSSPKARRLRYPQRPNVHSSRNLLSCLQHPFWAHWGHR